MDKVRLATAWLDGCSGCHMSFLDIDERLLAVADKIELVYSPIMDAKDYPENVDVCLVEGAVSSDEDLHKIKLIRARTKIVVALGDCAVTSNVPAMRNKFPVSELMQRAYVENATFRPGLPHERIPKLLPKSRPLHEVVTIDVHLPGCPPSNDLIFHVVAELLGGKLPELGASAHFG